MQGATEKLARFAASARIEEMPGGVVENAKLMLLDTIGVTLAAARDPGCRLLAQWVRDQEAAERSSVLGQGFRSSPLLAALANGHAAHALDYDDSGHYSTQTLPAALALGEPRRVSGGMLLRAYIVGREVCYRLDRALDAGREGLKGPTYRGWHHTGTNGSLGAAAAAGVIIGLTAEQMQTAFGIAANGAAGLRANMGTMAKALVSGNAARTGVMAATLAQRGFTAEKAVIETRQGLANAFCDEAEIDWEAMVRDLGARYELERGAVTKEYPCCSPAHRPIEALLKIVREHSIRPEEVERIECDLHAFSLRREQAGDSHEGQYSLRYCLAVALLDREMGLKQMTHERVRSKDVQELMRRLAIVPPPGGAVERRPKEKLTVYLANGRSYTAEVAHPRRISSREELEAKYFTCVEGSLTREAALETRATVLELEKVSDITRLTDLIRGN
ncbi:MAG TPA: MmgE/PrpD family protein [Candidatus Acidoferrales bacterium]|nr:MmgE/PrpD family protein [Candidatus Acidoferrales bacterium]